MFTVNLHVSQTFSLAQCAPEYKVPGLYVIDSIVRQSRHQFGQEKDVYGPRFSKNFDKTFHNLFVCPPDDQVHCSHWLQLSDQVTRNVVWTT